MTSMPSTSDSKFLRQARSRSLMRLFFLSKLPLALFAGLRIDEITAERCVVSLPYGWRSTNPFRSIYFAAQAMAAELSTGALAMAAIEASKAPVALLIVGLEATFEKKAGARLSFTCEAGPAIYSAVAQAIETGEPQTVRAETIGRPLWRTAGVSSNSARRSSSNISCTVFMSRVYERLEERFEAAAN